jgi:hypothetical protein
VQLIEPITGIAQAIAAASFKYDKTHRIYKEDGLALARALHFLADELSVSSPPSLQTRIVLIIRSMLHRCLTAFWAKS